MLGWSIHDTRSSDDNRQTAWISSGGCLDVRGLLTLAKTFGKIVGVFVALAQRISHANGEFENRLYYVILNRRRSAGVLESDR